MVPGTGSAGWDLVLGIAIALTMLVAVILLIKNRRDR
jgi:hypothetical protein